MSIQDDPRAAEAPNALLARIRRRAGRVGTTLIVLGVLLTGVVIFAVCACKSGH
jgi:hypothetical protein